MSVLVIAEAGVNHNGSLDMARRLIDAAADAKADAVKFQSFRAANIVSRSAPKAQYQERTTGTGESQFEMIKRLELSVSDHRALIDHANAAGIAFFSTPFDEDSVDMLTGEFGLNTIKVASGEITNGPLLLRIARSGATIILSTGMSSLADIRAALGVLAFGMSRQDKPSSAAFAAALDTDTGQRLLRERVILLHCTTEYPAPLAEVNLRAMDAMRDAFGLPVGYSDHTEGIHVSVAAVARGAVAIEKHFTLDRSLPGPDHKASLEPSELKTLVSSIRDVELALGDGEKRASESEQKNRDIVRKSLVAAADIRSGETLTSANMTCKRPGTGVSPMRYWDFVGLTAAKAYRPDDPIEP